MKKIVLTFCSVLLLITNFSFAQTYLKQQGTVKQLYVKDKPFLILGGELGNSSSSNNEYMNKIWPKIKSMNLNTILAPVYWELIEPEEGKFDFNLVDSLIYNARKNDIGQPDGQQRRHAAPFRNPLTHHKK